MPDSYRCIKTATVRNTGKQAFTEGRVYIDDSTIPGVIIFINDYDEPHLVAPGSDAYFLNEHFTKIEPATSGGTSN